MTRSLPIRATLPRRRASAPPHCMYPVEGDGAGADASSNFDAGKRRKRVATEYHCMDLTGRMTPLRRVCVHQ